MGPGRYRLRAGVRFALANVRRYTEREFGSAQAAKYLEGFRRAFARLADLPSSSPLLGSGSDLRMALYGLHRIFYREHTEEITIELIVDQRQDFLREIERSLGLKLEDSEVRDHDSARPEDVK